MCVNYVTVSRKVLYDAFETSLPEEPDWPEEPFQDYLAPIIIANQSGQRQAHVASYSMIPKNHIPPGVKRFNTVNARSETVGQLRSYSGAWKRHQLCLVPMHAFYEPNYESGAHIRWKISLKDHQQFAVAGLYRTWEEADGRGSFSFTQLTINADDHPFMRRFHKPGEEKRSLIIISENEYDDWLNCKDPERARAYFQAYPAEKMFGQPAPIPKKIKSLKPAESKINLSLF